ncbi:calcium-activated chloride channel regulator 1-like [Mixophyes fleayi]|uniref:calcium-activated chloride channel regulator 1-like n=1 Tax=Mixophyes fleayi TaxID=3061075 RepID=UPI003F4E07BB
MAVRNVFLLLLIFSVLYTSKGSLVKVNNGGYEDIVIAINPDVKEDIRIIEQIQNMVNEATSYLFLATRKRLFIKSVKILIPSTWTSVNNYTKPTTETYDTAEIIIGSPYLKYGYDPYTLQYGRCGEPGRYIHLTPNFLLDDNLLSVYGPRGRVFVHEWAHLRWGVYDEYNNDKPYYVAGHYKVEATRCSMEIFGINIIQTSPCHGEDCPIRGCIFDVNTGLYEKGCVFLPDILQFVQHSIMYAQALSPITEFCDSSNHNTEAPTLQNRMCNSRSTWEVIMNSVDISSTPPRPHTNIPVPTFSLLQYRDRVLTLVLDVSGSMSLNDRIERLHQAVDVFLTEVIETSSYVGIVQFSSSPSVISSLVKIDNMQREKLKLLVPDSATKEGTNICSGILSGLEVNKHLDGSAHGTEIVLLTDGEDNYDTRLCFPDITASGAIIHVIALGPYAEKELENIAEMTGGLQFAASDNRHTNGLIDAFSGILSANGRDSQKALQLESTALNLQSAECLKGTVFVDSTVGNDTFFLVTWQTAVPSIHLQDPKGNIYNAMQFTNDVTSKLSRLQIPGTAERGPWDYSLCNSFTSDQVIGITVTSKAADENVPPIIASCHMNKNTNNYPDPMVIYASVSQGLLPVTGVKVTAIIEPESGNSMTVELLDNGAGVDIAKNDGIYSRYLTTFSTNGRYILKVRAISEEKKSRLTLPKSSALYIPGFNDKGKITINPPRPTVNEDDLQVNFGAFSRTASGGSFLLSNVPSGEQPDLLNPEKISDLEARLVNRRIVLSWTATGDDLDHGQASSYELRMNTDPKEIRDNFETSTLVNTASLIPLSAGSRETFTFAPENVKIINGTILYFAIIAIDKVFQKSDMSNIAQAAFYDVPILPTSTPLTSTPLTSTPLTSTPLTSTPLTSTPHTTTTTDVITNSKDSGGLNVTTITLIICCTTIIICLLICIVICVACHKTKVMFNDSIERSHIAGLENQINIIDAAICPMKNEPAYLELSQLFKGRLARKEHSIIDIKRSKYMRDKFGIKYKKDKPSKIVQTIHQIPSRSDHTVNHIHKHLQRTSELPYKKMGFTYQQYMAFIHQKPTKAMPQMAISTHKTPDSSRSDSVSFSVHDDPSLDYEHLAIQSFEDGWKHRTPKAYNALGSDLTPNLVTPPSGHIDTTNINKDNTLYATPGLALDNPNFDLVPTQHDTLSQIGHFLGLGPKFMSTHLKPSQSQSVKRKLYDSEEEGEEVKKTKQ